RGQQRRTRRDLRILNLPRRKVGRRRILTLRQLYVELAGDNTFHLQLGSKSVFYLPSEHGRFTKVDEITGLRREATEIDFIPYRHFERLVRLVDSDQEIRYVADGHALEFYGRAYLQTVYRFGEVADEVGSVRE